MSEIKKHLLNQIESSNQFFWLKSRHFLVSKFIEKYGIKNVIDVGAGIGGLGDALKKNNNVEYFFIEIDEKSQKVLEEKFSIQHNLLNKTKNFDGSKCIAFLDVIEHVKYHTFTSTFPIDEAIYGNLYLSAYWDLEYRLKGSALEGPMVFGAGYDSFGWEGVDGDEGGLS